MPLLSCAHRSSDAVRGHRVEACWRWHRTGAVVVDGRSCDLPADVDNLHPHRGEVVVETGAGLARSQIRVLAMGRVNFCCPFWGVLRNQS